MSIIDTLPVSVRPALFQPFWLGDYHDVSDNANAVTISGSPYWQTVGIADRAVCRSTSQFSVAHDSSLDLTNGSLFIHGIINKQFVNQTFLRKLGTGVRYQLYSSNGSNLVLFDGVRSSSLTVDITAHTSIGVSWVGGAAPTFYLSGSSAGAGSQIVVTVGTDQALAILNGSGPADIQCTFAGVWSTQLSAAEFAALDAYGNAAITPRLQWPGAGLTTGVPAYQDNIQTARLSLANETSGQLSNTGMGINTGTWKLSTDATGRHYECVSAGQLERRLLGADAMTTDSFVEVGSATLTKNPTNIQIDAIAGDKIREVILSNP
jgi:hypothetical protein